MEINLAGVSLVLSITTLSWTVYKDYFWPATLRSSIDRVLFTRLFSQHSAQVNAMGFMVDFNQDPLQDQINRIMLIDGPQLTPYLNGGRPLDERFVSILQNHNYVASDQAIIAQFGSESFPLLFAIPLTIYNSGKQHSYISSICAIAERLDDSASLHPYNAYIEYDLDKWKTHTTRDTDRFKSPIIGYHLPPGGQIRIAPLFQPITNPNGALASETQLIPGFYKISVSLYNEKGDRSLQLVLPRIEITTSQMLSIARGSEHFCSMRDDANLSKALRSRL